MKRVIKLSLLILVSLLFCIDSSFADLKYFEYSDAPEPYADAWHITDTWQKLGKSWDNETGPKTPDLDTSDDGVWWSLDGGKNWGHEEVYAGQTIRIRVTMWSAGFGNHDYDQVKAWIDLDQNSFWDNDKDTELIISEQFFKPEDMIVDDSSAGYTSGPDAITDYYADVTFADDLVGDIWLRARVSCNHTSFADTTPYGELWQGEVEDWKIIVNHVPVPTSIILLGSGLFVFVCARRKYSGVNR